LTTARQLDLDLVEVAPNANPPVCRIMDYGKFKFDEAQRAKESRRKTTSTSIKEMKYRPKISTGDFDTKTRQVQRFLSEGHKVKITIMFRGREMSHPELGKRILDHVAEQVAPGAKVEAAPKLDGRNMIMVLAPDRRAQQVVHATRAADADHGNGAGAAPAPLPARQAVPARAAVGAAGGSAPTPVSPEVAAPATVGSSPPQPVPSAQPANGRAAAMAQQRAAARRAAAADTEES
jgi:translation initiation factor IF-3